MTEPSSWPNDHEELAKHAIDRVDEFPYPVLTDMYREIDRSQTVLNVWTYYDDDLYAFELVMHDEQLLERDNQIWMDQFDRQLQRLGESLDRNGVDRDMGEWGRSPVEVFDQDEYSEETMKAIIRVETREPHVRDLVFDWEVVDESDSGDRLHVSCTVGENTIGETVRIDEYPGCVEDSMDSLEQRALGLIQYD